jgi:hypothetical protein
MGYSALPSYKTQAEKIISVPSALPPATKKLWKRQWRRGSGAVGLKLLPRPHARTNPPDPLPYAHAWTIIKRPSSPTSQPLTCCSLYRFPASHSHHQATATNHPWAASFRIVWYTNFWRTGHSGESPDYCTAILFPMSYARRIRLCLDRAVADAGWHTVLYVITTHK